MSKFVMFGAHHVWAICATLSLATLLPLAVKRLQSEKMTRWVAIFMAVVVLAAKAFEPVYRTATGQPWQNDLPLHLCDIGGVFAGVMLITRNYRLYELTYFWGFGGALQAILTPSLTNDYPHFDYWFYFGLHAFVIVAATYATVLFRFRPTLASIWRAFASMLLAALVVAPLNWLLGTNYMYLLRKPETASIFDYLGPWPWYLVALIPVSVIFFLLCYSPFWLKELITSRNSAEASHHNRGR